MGVLSFLQFCNHLLYIPGSIVASSLYRISRLYPLWKALSTTLLSVVEWGLAALALGLIFSACLALARQGQRATGGALATVTASLAAIYIWATWLPEPDGAKAYAGSRQQRPNIVMIGSDTLRADRLGAADYYRRLTPFIDKLARRGTQFTNCFVPLARTAPSITSILTGTWPHTHGIRGNYNGDERKTLPAIALPEILQRTGYQTAVVGDWAAGDLGKFRFGFDVTDVSEDQWNLKYLLRQGPKDIRLFLSLFTHNRFGKTFLPEIYYLAGVPLTKEVGKNARSVIKKLAENGQPFFVNVFIASTHGPFGSPYPYYKMYTDPAYRGESLFSMSGLSSPEEREASRRPASP